MTEKTNTKSHILLVDDEKNVLQSYEITLNSAGIDNLILCSDSRTVTGILKEKMIELVILDLTMPFISGEKLLGIITQEFPEVPVIIITGNMEIDSAVKCMQEGAFDYIVKPVERERFISRVQRALERNILLKENKVLKSQLLSTKVDNPDTFATFNSRSEKMLSIFKYVEAIASSPEPILLTGETGVGKELMARAIHRLSGCEGPFVPVCIAGLDENMFSDTLFGHKKGAFTDAHNERGGLIEKASGGTLFLDEIGDLRPQSQVKLLRLIQEKEYFRIGDDTTRAADTHIVAATNRDLHKLMKSEQFRKDLFYRLEVHNIHIPPIRERIEDIPVLIDCFLEEASQIYKKKKPTVPNELYTILRNYSFPGNVRELRSMIFNAVSSYGKGILSLESFRKSFKHKDNNLISINKQEPTSENMGFKFPRPLPSLRLTEISLIKEAMKDANGNQSVASGILGITRQTLNKKLKLIRQD